MAYGGFPIFTRRYTFHGLENFAFDLLLGKPCLIVAHHDIFEDGGAALVELIEKIASLNCNLRWCSLGQVIRRACRRRTNGVGKEEIEMYANDLLVDNPSDQTIELTIRKQGDGVGIVSEIQIENKPARWQAEGKQVVIHDALQPGNTRRFRIVYRDEDLVEKASRSVRFELSVALRRILCELRDDFSSKKRFLSGPMNR